MNLLLYACLLSSKENIENDKIGVYSKSKNI